MEFLNDLLLKYTSISLEEMKAVKLMNRLDTKFLVSRAQLPALLECLQYQYFVQTRGDRRSAHYRTLYYDTPDVQMYLAHHNRKLTRQKLRARIYCDSQDAFCEIKNKTNKGRTKKKRVPLPSSSFADMLAETEICAFVKERLHYDINAMIPQVENEFDRITLVNFDKTERLTIDLNIRFKNRVTGRSADLPQLAIIELKQDGNVPSFFKSVLLKLRVKPKRISKYCLGTILTNPNVKSNRFNNKLRYINKLSMPTNS